MLTITKNNGVNTWYYDFTLRKHRYRGWLLPESAMSRRQAVAELSKIKAAIIVDKSPITQSLKKVTVESVFSSYEAYLKEHKPSTWKRQRYMFKNFKFFHSYAEIATEDVSRYQKKRIRDGVSGATVNREVEVARAAFNRSINIDKRWRGDNPFSYVTKYPEEERTRYLSEEELLNLLIACKLHSSPFDKVLHNPHLHDIVMLAILTGKRLDEILKLHASDINLKTQTITKKATGSVKYKKDKFTHINDVMLEIIERRLADTKSGYLFENPNTGKPYNKIKKSFASCLRHAGITDFRFHDLRHSFATYALMLTNDMKSVQDALGHSTIAQTSKYTHVLDKKRAELSDGVGAFVSGLVDKNLDNGK